MTMMKSVFNFPAIKRIMHGLDQKPKFRVKIDCMNGGMSHCSILHFIYTNALFLNPFMVKLMPAAEL